MQVVLQVGSVAALLKSSSFLPMAPLENSAASSSWLLRSHTSSRGSAGHGGHVCSLSHVLKTRESKGRSQPEIAASTFLVLYMVGRPFLHRVSIVTHWCDQPTIFQVGSGDSRSAFGGNIVARNPDRRDATAVIQLSNRQTGGNPQSVYPKRCLCLKQPALAREAIRGSLNNSYLGVAFWGYLLGVV